jgi:hypothetical protein
MTSPSDSPPSSSLIEVPNDIADRAIIDQATTADMRATVTRRKQIKNKIPAILTFPVTQKFLIDGYISYTFTPQIAEFYLVQLLFRIANSALIQVIRDPNRSGAFFVFNHPSYYSPPPLTISGRSAWVLDYDVKSGGSVVPQHLWFPQGEGDRRRYMDQARFSVPVFFVGIDGSLGVPVMNAAAGHMQLRDAHMPPQLQDKKVVKIRIAVRALFFLFCAFSHHLPRGATVAGL